MKHLLTVFLLALLFCSGTSTKTIVNKRCNKILKNDYTNITEDKIKFTIGNNIFSFTEVRYECVYTGMYIQKGMFDKFGKWDKIVYPKGKRYPIFFWINKKLFADDATLYTVASDGLDGNTIYTSVAVFDNDNNDLLSTESISRKKLIDYFSNLIRTDNPEKKYFYEVFWKTVNPERWEDIKKNNK